jgi:large subunit ribosomal protein L4
MSNNKKLSVVNMDNNVIDSIDIPEIFNVEIKRDILAKIIRWQLAKRRAGTHATKGVSDVRGTTKKPYKQKGTGNARQGSLRSAQFRGGGIIFGPQVRSHEFDVQKKVRKLGLRMALASKIKAGNFVILENASIGSVKTKDMKIKLGNFTAKSALFIDNVREEGFVRALRNLHKFDILPSIGANVYDILRHDLILVSKSTFASLEERLK